jgi:hypothetical protein
VNNGAKTSGYRGALAHRREYISAGEVRNIPSDFKISFCSIALCVDDSFRDTFSVELRNFIDKLEIFKQNRTYREEEKIMGRCRRRERV